MIKKIGILTSGGDSPGMNACIRAVVRTALFHDIAVTGFMKGFEGLIDDDHLEMKRESVSGIIQKGGTILKTARSERFMTEDGMSRAVETVRKHKLDAMVIIGGDGTFKGARALHSKIYIPMMGCAGTIDNDLVGTDYTIGYDPAVKTVIDAIDKIRDTADSQERAFVVEVIGRDVGMIALRTD